MQSLRISKYSLQRCLSTKSQSCTLFYYKLWSAIHNHNKYNESSLIQELKLELSRRKKKVKKSAPKNKDESPVECVDGSSLYISLLVCGNEQACFDDHVFVNNHISTFLIKKTDFLVSIN